MQQVPRLLLLVTLASCGANKIQDGPPRSGSASIPELPADAVPRPEPRSPYGNVPVYEVFGEWYTVMHTSDGYKEKGVASWYGNKFHGRPTASREPYDMHAMTAAHKTLPIPTYVRVRNLSNNKSVTVRVNDRGPFVGNRIIDLSYSAALKLDMIRSGTSLVEVEAISFDAPSSSGLQDQDARELFAQIGAFGSRENAERQLEELRAGGISKVFVLKDTAANPNLYRVRIGPIKDVVQYDLVVAELNKLGITDPYLITD
jgi:rare lipoprotein A